MTNPKYKLTLKEYPIEQRPRERLCQLGPAALTDRELIALLLSTGSKEYTALELADSILTKYEGLKGLVNLSVEEFASFTGVGPGKAARILAGIEIGKRINMQGAEFKPTIQSPDDVSNLVMDHG